MADEARASSASALAALRAGGVSRIVMMTGDRKPVALSIGAELGLAPDEIYAEMLPQDKVRQVGEFAHDGKVAFVGDGVNDATHWPAPMSASRWERPARTSRFRRPMSPCYQKT